MDSKIAAFRQLHENGKAFVIPNPWDAGSAKYLENAGFKALATTSSGYCYSMGMLDGRADPESVLEHCQTIVEATSLPVSADLGKGFGDSPEDVANTVRRAAATGIAGCSIEDYSYNDESPIFDFELALDRVTAACEAKQGLATDLVLTARSDNYICGIRNLDDTYRRLEAFEKAGADVLYPPGVDNLDDIKQLTSSLTRPLNIVAESLHPDVTLQQLADVGVIRISLGAGMYLAAMGGFMACVKELNDKGSLQFLSTIGDYNELEALFTPKT